MSTCEVVLVHAGELTQVEGDTLGLVCRHLQRVCSANNKMGVDSLAMIFGLVLIWPDPNAPLNLALATGQMYCSDKFLGCAESVL